MSEERGDEEGGGTYVTLLSDADASRGGGKVSVL